MKLAALILALVLVVPARAQMPTPPRPFVSDGCTGWFDGDWWECCEAHDLDYWYGGSYFDRQYSDAKLARCVARKGHPVHAWLMHYFVRGLGFCYAPWSARWGAGWPWPQCGPE